MNLIKQLIYSITIGGLLCFSSCNSINTSSELIDYIPEDSEVLIKLQGTEQKWDRHLLNRLLGFEELKTVSSQLDVLKQFNPENKGLMALIQLEKNKLDFLVVNHTPSSSVNATISSTVHLYNHEQIQTYELGDEFIYSWNSEGIHFLSSSQLLIENSIRSFGQTSTDHQLSQLYQKSSRNNLFINAASNSWWSQQMSIGVERSDNLAHWIALETSNLKVNHSAHGISTLNDSIEHFLFQFKGQKPIEHRLASYAPYTTESIWSFGVTDFERFDKNKSRYLGKKHLGDSILNSVNEFAQVSFNDQKVHLIRATYADQLFEDFSSNSIIYQGYPIAEFIPGRLSTKLYPLLDLKTDRFSCLIDDVLLTSSSREALKTTISSFNTKASFDRSAAYQTLEKELASRSNIIYIGSLSKVFKRMKDEPKEVFGLQWVADNNFFHTHMSLSSIDSLPNNQKVAPLFSTKLEAPIRLGPFVVTNHYSGEKELIVQDQLNQLYLIDNKGSVLWKKNLGAPINEIIHQVDLYRNKRLQLAFTTTDQFLVLDRNGKEVEAFTRSFKDGNLGPLAVFDYDHSRNYRMVFSQGTSIYMLNAKAKKVNGFKFEKAAAPLLELPKHFRISDKDYLVFKLANGKLNILNRRGNTRIKTPKHYDFSTNEVFAYQGHFVFSDREGMLHFIDQKGKEVQQDLLLDSDHHIDIKEEGIASLSGRQLKFRTHSYTLPYGSYADLKLIQKGNRFFITTTDKDSNKIYLFDQQLNLLDQFPVFGYSTAELADLNKDGVLELISLDGPDGIIVYSGL